MFVNVQPKRSWTIRMAAVLEVPETYALLSPSVVSCPVGVPSQLNPDLQFSQDMVVVGILGQAR